MDMVLRKAEMAPRAMKRKFAECFFGTIAFVATVEVLLVASFVTMLISYAFPIYFPPQR